MHSLKLKRLMAIIIDFILIIFVSTIITTIITFDNFNLSASTFYKIISTSIYCILFIAMFISKDLLFKNASLGKKIFGLEIFLENNKIPNKKTIIKRTSFSFPLFPIDIILIILNNKTRGDVRYKTKIDFSKNYK
jgi:uncharacterized RDD family membrane protein YckC